MFEDYSGNTAGTSLGHSGDPDCSAIVQYKTKEADAIGALISK